MKFVSNKEKVEDRTVVAFIDYEGDLWINVNNDVICIGADNIIHTDMGESDWRDEMKSSTQKFYKGDSVTITF